MHAMVTLPPRFEPSPLAWVTKVVTTLEGSKRLVVLKAHHDASLSLHHLHALAQALTAAYPTSPATAAAATVSVYSPPVKGSNNKDGDTAVGSKSNPLFQLWIGHCRGSTTVAFRS